MLQDIKRITDLPSLNNTKYRKFSLRLRWVQSSTFPGQKKKNRKYQNYSRTKDSGNLCTTSIAAQFLMKKMYDLVIENYHSSYSYLH